MTARQLEKAVVEHPKYRMVLSWLEIATTAISNGQKTIESQQAEIARLQAQLHNVRREVM